MQLFLRRALLESIQLPLGLIGCASGAIYFFYFVRTFPLAEYYDRPLMDMGKITLHTRQAGYSFLAAFTALFLLYYLAYRLARRRGGASFGTIASFGLLFCATLIQVYPIGAADVFDYISEARVLSIYGQNPYFQTPADFPGDPLLRYAAWKYAPAAYGPVWTWLSAAVTTASGDSLFANLVAFKLLAIAFYLASAWIVYRILLRGAPQFTLSGTILFAWNPLVVFEVAANAHNDIAMVFLLLVAVFFLQRDKKKLSIAVLALSYLLKYVTVALLPLFLATTVRRVSGTRSRLWFFATAMLIAIGMSALLYWPFWMGLDTLDLSRRQTMFTASFPALALTILEPRLGAEPSQLLLSRAAAIALGAYVIIQTWRSGLSTSSTIRSSFEVLFFYLLFACLWFQPWYLLWLVALAALLTPLDIAHRTVLFSYAATLTYFVFAFYWVWNAGGIDGSTIQQHAVAAIYLLPIAYTAYSLVRARLANQSVDSHNY